MKIALPTVLVDADAIGVGAEEQHPRVELQSCTPLYGKKIGFIRKTASSVGGGGRKHRESRQRIGSFGGKDHSSRGSEGSAVRNGGLPEKFVSANVKSAFGAGWSTGGHKEILLQL